MPEIFCRGQLLRSAFADVRYDYTRRAAVATGAERCYCDMHSTVEVRMTRRSVSDGEAYTLDGRFGRLMHVQEDAHDTTPIAKVHREGASVVHTLREMQAISSWL